MHARYFVPGNVILTAAGDFEPFNKGGDQWPDPLDKLGTLHRVELRDPVTGEARE